MVPEIVVVVVLPVDVEQPEGQFPEPFDECGLIGTGAGDPGTPEKENVVLILVAGEMPGIPGVSRDGEPHCASPPAFRP